MPASLSWQEKLENCRKFGFDWLEISIDETEEKLSRLDWTSQQRRPADRTMLKSGVGIKTMCLSGHRKYPLGSLDPQDRQRSLEIMEKAIDLARSGNPADSAGRLRRLLFEGSAQTRKEFIQNLLAAQQLWPPRKGVTLGFETMETPFMNTVEKAMSYVRMIDSPYLGVYPDIGNLTNASALYGVSVPADLENGRGHLWAAPETRPGDLSGGGVRHRTYAVC